MMEEARMVVEYAFYRDTYRGGSISETEWSAFEARAAEQLTRFKRIYTVTAPSKDAESMAVCAMADAICYFSAGVNSGGQLSSASIGSVSVGYVSTNAVDLSLKAQAKELYRCAATYLEIYRGVG